MNILLNTLPIDSQSSPAHDHHQENHKKPSNHLFFEIFSEEIPAKMQKHAGQAVCETLSRLLTDEHIHFGPIQSSCSSRRLWAYIKDVKEHVDDQIIEKRGPKIGAPEAALQGFLRANNLTKQDLCEKNGYWFASITQKGKSFLEMIPFLFSSFIHAMPWPKSMHWYNPQTGTHTFPWVRPVRGVMCFFGNQVLHFEIPEWGLKTSDSTFGNRFIQPTSVRLTSPQEYKQLMKEHFVLSDYNERQQAVVCAIEQALSDLSQQQIISTSPSIHSPSNQTSPIQKQFQLKDDQRLLDEVTGLMEYPFALVGKIQTEFMVLPEFVLSTSMRVHQKYFTVLKSQDQKSQIAPYFIAISNHKPDDLVVQGFEKVLKARLSDALFFYTEDLKSPLESRRKLLDHVTFHAGLGTLGQKVERLEKLVSDKIPGAKRAAALCKIDLTTNMVGEFNELQGICGAHYAEQQKESPETVQAMAEHYKPVGPDDSLPQTLSGQELALADKVDTLVGFIGLGLRPSGSKDPFALRRTALGIIRLGLNSQELNIKDKVQSALRAYEQQNIPLKDPTEVESNVINFLYERLNVYMKDILHIRFDIISSVLAFQRNTWDPLNLYEIKQKAEEIQSFFSQNESTPFLLLFNRVSGIMSSSILALPEDVDCSLFETQEEHEIQKTLTEAKSLSNLLKTKHYKQYMTELSKLWPVFERFFQRVQINTSNSALTKNRQLLLKQCWNLFDQLAVFSKIQEN